MILFLPVTYTWEVIGFYPVYFITLCLTKINLSVTSQLGKTLVERVNV